MKEIGKDGLKIYRNYISTKESKETGTSYLDSGSLYDGFQFFPPTPKRLPTEEKHLKKTIIYGQVYNGE